MNDPRETPYVRAQMQRMEQNFLIGANLQSLREDRGMTQKELAKAACVSQAMISQVEKGLKALTLPLALQLTGVLHCTLEDFITFPMKQK